MKTAKVLNMTEWTTEVEHVMIERIRAGIYVAECDEAVRRLMEKAPVAHGEALLAVLDIAKKLEANYAAQIATAIEEPVKKPPMLKRIADVFRPAPTPGLMPLPASELPADNDRLSLSDSQEIEIDVELPRSEVRTVTKPVHPKKKKWIDGQMVG